MVRLAAFDMDGTLLLPNHRFGEETRQTLRRLRAEREMTLVFATGRHVLEMRHIPGHLGLEAFLITGNGTRIHDAQGNQLYSSDLAPQVAEAVIAGHWKTRASMHLFNDNGWFTGQLIPELMLAHEFSGFRPEIVDLQTQAVGEVTKICFCGEGEDLRQLALQLHKVLGDSAALCFSAESCLEVLPRGSNKGAALEILTAHLGMRMQECMAFGDAMNDFEMLSAVGHGLIMGNAMAQLKAALPHLPVIGHCGDEAVAHYLTHWLEIAYSPEY